MLKPFIILLSLLILLPKISPGRILPYGAHFITMSSTNADDITEFNFTMITENPIPTAGSLEIEFPAGQFQTGLGLPNTIIVYAPYPIPVTASISDRTVTCAIGSKDANIPFTVTVENILNPLKVGGTGNFKIRSKINGYVIDETSVFGVIGISDSSSQVISASLAIEDGQSAYAGETTNYILTFIPSDNIQANIIIRIVFPEIYNLNYFLPNQVETITYQNYQLSGNLVSNYNVNFNNMLDIIGNSAVIPKGQTVQIRIKAINNPPISMTTDLITLRILDKGSNNTIQIQDSIPGLDILPGIMSNVDLIGYYPNYLFFKGYTRIFKLSFKPRNPFNAIRISTKFPLITSCYVDKGLLDIDLTSNIQCITQSNIMMITNFETYVRSDFANDYIEITFTATLPSRLYTTNPLEIYTYLDTTFLTLVDQDTESLSTAVTIIVAPTIAAGATIATLPTGFTSPSTTTGFLVTLNLGATVNLPNIFQMEIPYDYTGTPICQCKIYRIKQYFINFI